MGSATSRYVPAARAKPAPEPPNAWDTKIVEGPHRHRIAALLDELTEIAEVDWQWRHLLKRRNEIFVELAKMQITMGRMKRAYAIASPPAAEGKPIITHVSILQTLRRAGVPAGSGPPRPNSQEEEEADE